MKDLYTVASNFVDRLHLNEEAEYDGGNEFNHLEQAIYSAQQLDKSLQSLGSLNPGKYDKYRDTIKKVKEITKEFPPLLDSLATGEEDIDEPSWDDEDSGIEDDEGTSDEDESPFEEDESPFEEDETSPFEKGEDLNDEEESEEE